MNYEEIKELSLSYADKQDIEVIDAMDNFIRMVEARLNRLLDIQKQVIRSSIEVVDEQFYYGLPSDFKQLRSLATYDPDTPDKLTTLQFRTPEQMNNIAYAGTSCGHYNISANQLRVGSATVGNRLEILYYRSLPPLGISNSVNWISIDNPDVYVLGILVEINSFVKDAEAAALWDARFKQAISEIELDDSVDRWSGTPLTVRIQ